jgi:CHASE2 domain-containing sensor protein
MQRLWINSLYGTLFIFAVLLAIYKVSALGIFNLFDPIGDALSDMEFTDVVFSRLRETPKADTNIVIVNIGNLTRREIAQEISIVNQFKPKVIGLDIRFLRPKADTLGDIMLSEAIKNAGNVIIACRLEKYNQEKDVYDSMSFSLPMFRDNAMDNSFVNLPTDNNAASQIEFKMTRSFTPRVYLKGDKKQEQLSFAVRLAQVYNPEITSEFLKRLNSKEIINFRGDIRSSGYQGQIGPQFTAIDIQDLFSGNFVPELFKNKIVIFGFLGSSFQDQSWEDKFFTPMNEKYAGKANPDMYGVVIHANAVSMILNKEPVKVLSTWLEYLISIILVYFQVVLFTILYRKASRYYDGLSIICVTIEILLLIFLLIEFFDWFTLKLSLTIAFAGIALAGNLVEVFYSIVMNLFSREGRSQLLKMADDD